MDPNQITYFGETDARSKKVKFGIKAKDRLKHMYIVGKTGMGKSTLLENLAIQDIQNGNGFAFLDPHGGTAEKLLEYIPEHRIKDVLYFAPFDLEYPVSFNVMEDVGADKRHLVVNGLMSTFEKIWADAWSARMSYILQYTVIALLEYPSATLLGINKMLSDKEYRKKVIDNLTDASARSFWIDEFGKYTEKFAAEATPAIQNKVGQFSSNPLVRNIIGQSKSSFDIREMMDNKKILIINLSKGRVGEGNANLLGSMLITKIYLAAMSRADLGEAEIAKLPNFYLYVDEFQSFANKSFANILSEARKYKLNLTIAHQYIEQMEEEVRDAVFGNVGSMITFRVGAFDAEVLEKEFAPVFTAEDLVNLGFTQIYLKLMIDGVSSAPFSATTMGPIKKADISFKNQVIESSRNTYARARGEVEKEIISFYMDKTSQSDVSIKKDRGFVNQNAPYIPNFQNREPRIEPNKNQINKKPEELGRVLNDVLKSTTDSGYKQPPIQSQKFFNPIIPVEREIDITKEDFEKNEDSEFGNDKNKKAFLVAKEELLKLQQNSNNTTNNTKDEPIKTNNNQGTIREFPPRQSNNFTGFKNNLEQRGPLKFQTDRPKDLNSTDVKLNYDKNKIPTSTNINSLKTALSSVLTKVEVKPKQENPSLKTEIPVVKIPAEEVIKPQPPEVQKIYIPSNNQKSSVIETATPPAPKEQNKPIQKEEKIDYGFVKEVPEDVLKKLLSMD